MEKFANKEKLKDEKNGILKFSTAKRRATIVMRLLSFFPGNFVGVKVISRTVFHS
jgi:hypothetical protein